ncbi:RDD family protein [Phaeobacter gallaeciensis]|uniref:RDD family protein n=2 Tax=Roseobacteraceae TaxID=2854170 RepID=A0A366WZC2_9RHOB|nr:MULTISPECIES: RDD family protein [Roseobacteraceae]MBT3139919.1 RDD family protein [Falsiruegeria litorea]MBT8170274.1 RDD family protein [Falsiruegeria litorea]RBW56799.1 RDD family protein [Phaeobacter gallaeciensis]
MTHLPHPDHQPEFYDSVAMKRLFAWVLDTIVILMLSVIIVMLTAFVGVFIWPLLYLVIGFIYRVSTLASGSATWGMRFVGIEIRDAYGARLDAGLALAHTAGYTFSMALPVIQAVSAIMMLTSARAQGLTDALLGTVALNKRAVA